MCAFPVFPGMEQKPRTKVALNNGFNVRAEHPAKIHNTYTITLSPDSKRNPLICQHIQEKPFDHLHNKPCDLHNNVNSPPVPRRVFFTSSAIPSVCNFFKRSPSLSSFPFIESLTLENSRHFAYFARFRHRDFASVPFFGVSFRMRALLSVQPLDATGPVDIAVCAPYCIPLAPCRTDFVSY